MRLLPDCGQGLIGVEGGRGGQCPFDLCCVESATLQQAFLERTLGEVDAARDWMLLLGRKSAGEKIASLLLLFSERLQGASRLEAAQFDLPLSRTEMAEYLGLRMETVSRKLKELQEAGLVQVANGRRITLSNPKALAHVAKCGVC
jgi:CRP/FNR family transcriptional regulator